MSVKINGIFEVSNPLAWEAEKYATEMHVHQKYDGQPYTVHLQAVVNVAKRFRHLVPVQFFILSLVLVGFTILLRM